MLQAHFFDFCSKTFDQKRQFSIVLKENNGEPSVIESRIYAFAKLVLSRLLVIIVRDSVITLSAIAYNVNNNLDEVLLAIVCTVYYGNMFNRSRFFLKLNLVEALYPCGSGGKSYTQG